MKNLEIDLIEKECEFYQQRIDKLCKAKSWHEINNSDGTLSKYFTHFDILSSGFVMPRNPYDSGTIEWNRFELFRQGNSYQVGCDFAGKTIIPRLEIEFKYTEYYSKLLGHVDKQIAFLKNCENGKSL